MAATESWGMAGGSSQGHGKWTGWTKPGMTHLLLRSSTEGGILDGWFVYKKKEKKLFLCFSFIAQMY